mmetsp:Transcript_24991/g.40009  ORF Transcript_24991/g.40009 Transcript_24991/m.40009 type:complete len:83 (+) Transcript_24991:1165-1413(+)
MSSSRAGWRSAAFLAATRSSHGDWAPSAPNPRPLPAPAPATIDRPDDGHLCCSPGQDIQGFEFASSGLGHRHPQDASPPSVP